MSAADRHSAAVDQPNVAELLSLGIDPSTFPEERSNRWHVLFGIVTAFHPPILDQVVDSQAGFALPEETASHVCTLAEQGRIEMVPDSDPVRWRPTAGGLAEWRGRWADHEQHR